MYLLQRKIAGFSVFGEASESFHAGDRGSNPLGDAIFTPAKGIEMPLSSKNLLQGYFDFLVLGLILISLNSLLKTICMVSGEAYFISWDSSFITFLTSFCVY